MLHVCPDPGPSELTPPWSPESCDDVFALPDQSVHRRSDVNKPPSKRRLYLRTDEITDQTLLEISRSVCSKYTELGIQLKLLFTEVQSIIGGLGPDKPDHLKAFYILQEWKARAGGDYSYQTLCTAMEHIGLTSTAHRLCYEQ